MALDKEAKLADRRYGSEAPAAAEEEAAAMGRDVYARKRKDGTTRIKWAPR